MSTVKSIEAAVAIVKSAGVACAAYCSKDINHRRILSVETLDTAPAIRRTGSRHADLVGVYDARKTTFSAAAMREDLRLCLGGGADVY